MLNALVIDALVLAAPPGNTLIPGLDALLSPPPPGETRDGDFHSAHPISSALQRGDMLELQGVSGSGKTSLALFLAVTTSLPDVVTLKDSHDQSREITIGGKGKSVVWIHPESHAGVASRMAMWMQAHVRHCLGTGQAQYFQQDVDSIVRSALSRITIIRLPHISIEIGSPYDPLAATLMSLNTSGCDLRQGADEEISLLVVDGFGDDFWAGRLYRELARTANTTTSAGNIKDGAEMRDVVKALTDLRRDTGAVVVVTTQAIWAVNPTTMTSDQGSAMAGNNNNINSYSSRKVWAQHLPSPYPNPFGESRSVRRLTTAPQNIAQYDMGGTQQLPSASFAPPPLSPPQRSNKILSNRDLYWPLTAHITLFPPQSSLRPLRPDLTLREAIRPGGVAEMREEARARAPHRGLVRMVDPTTMTGMGENGQGGEAGEFDFRIAADGLRFA